MEIKKTVILILAVINIIFCTVSYAIGVNRELSDDLLRLHILANSDSEIDQEIKLKVRDNVLFKMKDKNITSKEAGIKNISCLEKCVNDYLTKNNVNYSAKIIFDYSVFPKKQYGDFMLPNGKYECVKVLLGEAKGHNWWCVAYPPLCFEDMNKSEKLKKILSNEDYKIVYSKSGEYKIKFLTVDIINSIINKIMK